MKIFRKIWLYWQTIRHLKMEQIFYRILFRLRKAKVNTSRAPELNQSLCKSTSFAQMPVSWLGKDTFRFLNASHSLVDRSDWNRMEWGKLWLYNLHYFDYLRQDGISEEDGNRLIAKWISENPPGYGNGWEPYPLSLRIVNWIKWHLNGHPLSLEAVQSLAIQSRFLMQRIEKHLLANHFLANAKALAFAGMFFEGKEGAAFLQQGLKIYRRELPEQILADGGHFERSAMYHSIIFEDLLDLKNIGVPLTDLTVILPRMSLWLEKMTGPDGQIILFNDAAFGIAVDPGQLQDYYKRLDPRQLVSVAETCSVFDLPATGYTRIENGPWLLVADTAPIGPEYQPGHAHADTLSFELFYQKKRFIIDSGTMLYLDGEVRRQQRSSAGHNVLTIDEQNSSHVWGAHRVAERARIVEREITHNHLFAAHDGYLPLIVSREWNVEPETIVITDKVEGAGSHRLDLFFHLHPECRTDFVQEKLVRVHYEDCCIELSLPEELSWTLEDSQCSFEFGILTPCKVLHGSALNCKLPIQLECQIKVGK